MRLLTRRPGQQTVSSKRTENKIAPKHLGKHRHHSWMLHHINENITLVQQIPYTALKMNLVRMRAMKMSRCLRFIRMKIDNAVSLGNLLTRKYGWEKVIARSLNQCFCRNVKVMFIKCHHTTSLLWVYNPVMVRVIPKLPYPLWPSHHIEIITVIAMWYAYRMISFRHQNN